jgi:hemolysin III
MFTKIREPVSSITHLGGALIALVGLAALIARNQEGFPNNLALWIYGASLVIMFLASGAYHFVKASPEKILVLRKLDHAAIYLLIAGTYTPFCVSAFSGFWKWGLLAIIWGLAFAGIGIKLFTLHAPRWVTAGVYVLMGWMSVFAVREMLAALPPHTILWLFIGGITYTAGAVIYITRRMNFVPGVFGFHEVWHIFVLGGAAAHFAAVASLVTATVG